MYLKFIKKHIHIIALLIIFLISIVFGLYQIQFPMIAEGDAYSRAIIGKSVQYNKKLYLNSNPWLPFHFLILNIANIFTIKNVFFTQRFLTILISSLSLISIYFYTKINFKKNSISLLASFLFATLPLRMYLSTQTLSESVFLFFFITSLYYLIKIGKKKKEILLFIIFLNISHGLRYESWMSLPFIYIYLYKYNKENIKSKSFLAISTTIFPTLWIFLNFIIYQDIFHFFSEKYLIAQKGENEFYYNLSLTLNEWQTKLLDSFPLSYILLSIAELKNYFSSINKKTFLVYWLPVYLYFTLIIQVYLGTMEWFPTRYLLIPTSLLIPVIAKNIYSIIIYTKNILIKKTMTFNKVFISVTLLSSLLVIKNQYFYIKYNTEYIVTTNAFLSSFDNIPKNIDDSPYFIDFIETKNYILSNDNYIDFIEFYHRDYRKTWNDQALYYFTGKYGVGLSKSQYGKSQLNEANKIIVWEKETNDIENYLKEDQQFIFENNNYAIIESK